MIIQSLAFWTLVVGLVAFVLKFFLPGFPLDQTQILALVLFFLGLFRIVPSIRSKMRLGIQPSVVAVDILKSLPFWTLVAGVLTFVLHYFAPSFPMSETAILTLIVYILGFFQIAPELKERGLR